MYLQIDAGNTFTKWRLTSDDGAQSTEKCPSEHFIQQLDHVRVGELQLQGVLVASVLGEAFEQALRSKLQQRFGRRIVIVFAKSEHERNGLINAYADPGKMGCDRWLIMLQIWSELRQAFVVISAGSAITLDWVDHQGRHLGGYILPGLGLMQSVLIQSTKKIKTSLESSPLDVKEVCQPFENAVFGTDTKSCIDNGRLFFVESLLMGVQRKMLQHSIGHLYVTGGDGKLLQSMLSSAVYSEALVMDGLTQLIKK